ncbi:MAG: hypothetical protein JRN54_04760 [Nitrososphaerota archaeon]|nr:hypothetical protein [Nitrososphaerota archaeon]
MKPHPNHRSLALIVAGVLALLFLSTIVGSVLAASVVTVTVTSGGSPLANAQVDLIQYNGTATGLSPTLTGSNGQAALPLEGAHGYGTYLASASKFGYVNQTKEWTLTSSNVTTGFAYSLVENSAAVTITTGAGPSSPFAYVDGAQVSLPATEDWLIGSVHNVTAAATFPDGAGNSSIYAFSEWQGGPATRTLAYTASATATLTADYQTRYLLTERFNATKGALSPKGGYYNASQGLSILATPKAGFHFVNFTIDGIFVSTTNPLPLAMTGPHTVTAYFAVNSVQVAFTVQGPSSVPAVVDGAGTTLPRVFTWTPGTSHQVVLGQYVGSGSSRWALTSITLSGAAQTLGNITVAAGTSPMNYVLAYSQQYALTVNSTDARAVKPSLSWYASGASVTLTAPSNVTLSDGSVLVLKSYTVDGVAGTGLPLQLTMSQPHAVDWVYVLEYPLSASGLGNDGQSLGSGAYFVVTPPSGPTFQMANGATDYLPGGTYGLALDYAGATVNSTTVDLTKPTQVTLTVHVGGTAGAFTFHVFGGTLVSASLQGNDTLTLSVQGASGYVRIFVPPDAYYQDFFIVSGDYAASSFDQQQRLAIVNFTGPSTFTLEQPPGTVFILSGQQLVEALNGQAIVGEFSAFPVDPTHIGVNFQTLTSQEGVFEATPFKPITDPSGTYKLTFGYFTNGVVPVAVQAVSTQLTFKEALQTLEYGDVVETSALNAPTGNAYTLPTLAASSASQSGCADNAYEIDVLGQPFASMCWVLGTGNVPTLYVFNLQNQYVAGASVTTTNRTVLAVTGGSGSGSTQTIAFAFASPYTYTSATVIITGTAPVSAKELPSGGFGPVQVAFDPHSPTSANMVCTGGSCSEQASVFGAYDQIKVLWAALPQGAGFNVSVNGVPLIVDGNPSCAAARNLTSSQQPGIDLNQCVEGSASQGTAGDGYFTFTPARAGQFIVCVSQKSFAGDYSGCQTVYATVNGTLGTAGTAAVVIGGLAGAAVYTRKRHRPRPSLKAQGR